MADWVIGISGINAVDNPGPGVGVARAIKDDSDLKIKIAGLSYDALDPGIYMDWLIDKSYMMPYPSSGHEALIERLAYIKNHFGLDAVIPNLDVELPFYARYAREIQALGVKLFLPSLDQFKLRGKDQLESVAARIHISTPKTKIVTSYEELIAAVNEIGLPVMIKGIFYKALRASTVQEAVNHYHQISAEWGYPILVQEVVSGEEINLVGVGDGEGGSLGEVGIKKLWVTALGKIWTGVTVKNEALTQAARTFLSEYRWKGPFEFECILNEKALYLIEINPRFPAWVYFSAGVGVNLPAKLIRKMFDMPLKSQPDYEAGKMYVRYTYEMVTDMKTFQAMNTQGESPRARAV